MLKRLMLPVMSFAVGISAVCAADPLDFVPSNSSCVVVVNHAKAEKANILDNLRKTDAAGMQDYDAVMSRLKAAGIKPDLKSVVIFLQKIGKEMNLAQNEGGVLVNTGLKAADVDKILKLNILGETESYTKGKIADKNAFLVVPRRITKVLPASVKAPAERIALVDLGDGVWLIADEVYAAKIVNSKKGLPACFADRKEAAKTALFTGALNTAGLIADDANAAGVNPSLLPLAANINVVKLTLDVTGPENDVCTGNLVLAMKDQNSANLMLQQFQNLLLLGTMYLNQNSPDNSQATMQLLSAFNLKVTPANEFVVDVKLTRQMLQNLGGNMNSHILNIKNASATLKATGK